MTFWLDWKLFGNGHGMASPFFDDVFYWLHDGGPGERGGRFYRSCGGLGAQLHSVEWFAPPAGTRRRLCGYDFVIFHARRKWLRVECAWSMVRLPEDLGEAHAAIAEMRGRLGTHCP